MIKRTLDAIILGGGPAGLVAATQLSRHTHNFALVESGRPLEARDRDDPAQMSEGAGGAGLFSDGKFSGGAAASGLKTLSSRRELEAACTYVDRKLRLHGVQLPALMSFATQPLVRDAWFYKPYPSEYMSLDNRKKLVGHLLAKVRGLVCFASDVQSFTFSRSDPQLITVHMLQRDAYGTRQQVQLEARSLVLAGGRFGPLACPTLPQTFRRLEVGVRIQDHADNPFWTELKGLDPKYRYVQDTMEWRTFCCCRRGEVVATQTRGRTTLSGRADCAPTALSNIGFNWRVLDDALAARMRAVLDCHQPPAWVPLAALLQAPQAAPAAHADFVRMLGPAALYVLQGLKLLTARFASLAASRTAMVAGPTVEGVKTYPDVDDTLRVRHGLPIWTAGDCTGRFRGIVAAMVSGHYVAEQVARHLRHAVSRPIHPPVAHTPLAIAQ